MFGVTGVESGHVFFHGLGSWMGGLSIQTPFHFLSGYRKRSRRERELQLFSKLNLPYGSPAGWQRSQVSSSDKEEAKIISPKPNYFQKLNLSSHCQIWLYHLSSPFYHSPLTLNHQPQRYFTGSHTVTSVYDFLFRTTKMGLLSQGLKMNRGHRNTEYFSLLSSSSDTIFELQ